MMLRHLKQRGRAQIVPLFALGLIGFVGLVGMLLDGGTLYVQRRTAQNAADAAALAGARALQQTSSSASSTLSVPIEICTYVLANNFGVTPSASAYFVDVNGTKIPGGDITLPPNCSGGVSAAAILSGTAGVHVDIAIGPYNTYLAGIVGVRQLSAAASATAQVWQFAINANYVAPWATCGPTAPINFSGTLMDILDTSTNTILPSVIAAHTQVVLQDSHMNSGAAGWLPAVPACPDNNGSSWKGKISPSGLIIPPVNVPTTNGNGNVGSQCGATGQNSNPSNPGDCLLFVPVTDANNASGEAHVVTFACMDVFPGSGTRWLGRIESTASCPTFPYQPVWTFGSSNANTIVALTT